MEKYCLCYDPEAEVVPETDPLLFSVGADGTTYISGLDVGDEVNWGDGTVVTATDTTINHTYSGASYPVQVSVLYSKQSAGAYNPYGKNIVSVDRFPTEAYRTGFRVYGTGPAASTSLTSVPATLPSYITSLYYAFAYATSFNQPLNSWDTSAVTNMAYMFSQASAFNGDISAWDVSAVTDMSYMFSGAKAFNQPLDSWDVSAVTNMGRMFYQAKAFNQPLSSWDVSAVTNMEVMFTNATVFNQDLSGWCVTNIPTKPTLFANGSALTAAHTPVWGTCP